MRNRLFYGVRIDYCQDNTFYCAPDDSFSGRGWNIPFEHDESVRSLSLMRIALRNPGHGAGIQSAAIQRDGRSPPTIVGIHDGLHIPILIVLDSGRDHAQTLGFAVEALVVDENRTESIDGPQGAIPMMDSLCSCMGKATAIAVAWSSVRIPYKDCPSFRQR